MHSIVTHIYDNLIAPHIIRHRPIGSAARYDASKLGEEGGYILIIRNGTTSEGVSNDEEEEMSQRLLADDHSLATFQKLIAKQTSRAGPSAKAA